MMWLLINKPGRSVKIISSVGFASLFTEVLLLESRTAVLGVMASFLYSLFPHISLRFGRLKTTLLLVPPFLLILGVFIFCIKTNSANGRWFIWKLSIQLLEQNWLSGTGPGRFNPEFNHLQAEYFSNHSLYTEEAMLAADGFFSFNEWLQAGIELGITGFILAAAPGFLVLWACFRRNDSKDGWAGAAMMVILTGCFFSYPLHNFYILCFTAFLGGYLSRGFKIIRFKVSYSGKIVFFVLLIGILIFSIAGKKEVQRKFYTARELSDHGYKSDAYRVSSAISEKMIKDPDFSLFYFNLLFETNRLNEAITWFKKIHLYTCTHKLHAEIAKCYDELGNFEEAEKHFLTSLYIKPHLLGSRVNLMEFYSRHEQVGKTRFWANEILRYPAKVQNNRAVELKKRAWHFLELTKAEN